MGCHQARTSALGAIQQVQQMTGYPCAQGKTNFFERRVGEYQRAGVMAGMRPRQPSGERLNDYVFTTNEDF